MHRVVALAALALVSCGESPDAYTFDGAEFERRQQPVTVVEHSSLSDLKREAPDEAHEEGRELQGFSYLRSDGCEIHVTDLRKSAARVWLGHEMTHCVYGRWHK